MSTWEVDLFDKFEQTGDIRYAALAVGLLREEPPAWAVLACRRFFAEYEVTAQRFDDPVDPGPPLKNPHRDGMFLDRTADLVADGATIHAALQELLGEGTDGTEIRRLSRVWKKRSEEMASYKGKPVLFNRWLRKASRRGKVIDWPPRRPYRKRDEVWPDSLTLFAKHVMDSSAAGGKTPSVSTRGTKTRRSSRNAPRKPKDNPPDRRR